MQFVWYIPIGGLPLSLASAVCPDRLIFPMFLTLILVNTRGGGRAGSHLGIAEHLWKVTQNISHRRVRVGELIALFFFSLSCLWQTKQEMRWFAVLNF